MSWKLSFTCKSKARAMEGVLKAIEKETGNANYFGWKSNEDFEKNIKEGWIKFPNSYTIEVWEDS